MDIPPRISAGFVQGLQHAFVLKTNELVVEAFRADVAVPSKPPENTRHENMRTPEPQPPHPRSSRHRIRGPRAPGLRRRRPARRPVHGPRIRDVEKRPCYHTLPYPRLIQHSLGLEPSPLTRRLRQNLQPLRLNVREVTSNNVYLWLSGSTAGGFGPVYPDRASVCSAFWRR